MHSLLPTAVPSLFTNNEVQVVDVCSMRKQLQIKFNKSMFPDSDLESPNVSQSSAIDDLEVEVRTSTPTRKAESFSEGSNKRFHSSPKTPKFSKKLHLVSPKTRKVKALTSKLYFCHKRLSSLQIGRNNIISMLKELKNLVTPVLYNFISSQIKFSSVPYENLRYI
ncbi:uncharacterized protein [Parasteatoda tepidariorum]|uniref:uncharacterized protein n=1 Tax=Parasteatoda tepidariorum TaxID=114398 RepID=UPI0039BC4364